MRLTPSKVAEKIMVKLRKVQRPISTGRLWKEMNLPDVSERQFITAMRRLEDANRIIRKGETKIITNSAGQQFTVRRTMVELGVLERLASIPGMKSREQTLREGDRQDGA